ncbi:hypothetical protein [Burkholderia orbicola]|uniref:hypothetical protein n=1 Tax=Burkholderia orbicola TaxID=2978683 RepID=UPI002FE3C344
MAIDAHACESGSCTFGKSGENIMPYSGKYSLNMHQPVSPNNLFMDKLNPLSGNGLAGIHLIIACHDFGAI